MVCFWAAGTLKRGVGVEASFPSHTLAGIKAKTSPSKGLSFDYVSPIWISRPSYGPVFDVKGAFHLNIVICNQLR